MTTSNNSSIGADTLYVNDKDLNMLVYKFDSTRPWQYFVHGDPIASSVEKGRRNLATSHKVAEDLCGKE